MLALAEKRVRPGPWPSAVELGRSDRAGVQQLLGLGDVYGG